MADKENNRYEGAANMDQDGNVSLSERISPSVTPTMARETQPLQLDVVDLELLESVDTFTDEDAEGLIGPSMSRAATRLKSPNTPAQEKRNALQEGLRFFETDLDTPPDEPEGPSQEISFETPEARTPTNSTTFQAASRSGRGLSLGSLPPPQVQDTDFPTPWHAGPKNLIVPPERAQTSLQSVFGSNVARKRSLSGGAEALKKLLPKGLPSMAQVSNYFAIGSAGVHVSQKSKLGYTASPPKSPSRFSPLPSNASLPDAASRAPSPVPPLGFQKPIHSSRNQINPLRRVNSEDSVLYHTVSRSSSLGDDTLYESQKSQVNSRAKAIRDSLQDRSSFRMPNMPSLPKVPNFNFNMNFLNNENSISRARSFTDIPSETLPENVGRHHPVSPSSPYFAPGVTDSATADPRMVHENSKSSENGPSNILDRALETLTGDIVIMGGYRGSVLRATKTDRQVWAPVKIGLNIRKVDLEVGLEPEDEERMEETIYPSGMLQNIGPVDISRRLFKRLNATENARNGKLRVWDYGYDWRLSPHLLARKLTKFLENLPSNQPESTKRGALVIAHSLGGLITRHVVNHRPKLFSGVIYAGVPQSCVNILGPLRNGDVVLLSSRVLNAQVNFTLRTSFVLLPEDGACFVDINTKEKYPCDFFDIENWIKYRLSPCIDPALPPYAQRNGGIGGILNLNISSSKLALPLPGKKSSTSGSITPPLPSATSSNGSDAGREAHHASKLTKAANVVRDADGGKDRTLAPQMGNKTSSSSRGQNTNGPHSTTVTIPRDKALAYLRRTLAETKKFKQELYFKPELSKENKYPPMAVIYGKSIPTCCGAKVDGIESIPCADVYDNLAFAAGDGVCLAKEAMLPTGYQAVNGGRIRSERGHVTLLGDLNAVGRAIEAIERGRAKGIGLGI